MNGETRQRPHVNPADLAAHIIAATYPCQGRTQPGVLEFTSTQPDLKPWRRSI